VELVAIKEGKITVEYFAKRLASSILGFM